MNTFDKHLIFKSLKNLKLFEENLNVKPKSPGYVFVTEHISQAMQLQKIKLITIFKQARSADKKASWKIEGDEYLLYVDGIRIQISD